MQNQDNKQNLFVRKNTNANVYKANHINDNLVNVSFGNCWKNGSELFIPILYEGNSFCVQLSNLLSLELEVNDVENDNKIFKLTASTKCDCDAYLFMSHLNDVIENNLKKIIKRIKNMYVLNKKFNYDACYKFNEDICFTDFIFTSQNISDRIKIYNSNKQLMNFSLFSSHFNSDNFSFSVIVQPCLKIDILSG